MLQSELGLGLLFEPAPKASFLKNVSYDILDAKIKKIDWRMFLFLHDAANTASHSDQVQTPAWCEPLSWLFHEDFGT